MYQSNNSQFFFARNLQNEQDNEDSASELFGEDMNNL